jgi:hypothetical protein
MIKGKFNLKKITGLFFILQIIFALALLSLPTSSILAADAPSVPLQFTPQVTIPNSSFNQGSPTTVNGSLLARYILTYYNYGLAIVGILATIVLMGAGVIWLTSGGDAGKVSQAKELISGSIVGMAILVCAWIILNTINPNLTQLASISPTVIGKVDVAYLNCCDPTTGIAKFPIKIVNGKNMAADGSNVIISCKAPASACAATETCTLNTLNKYSCFADKWSCSCKVATTLGHTTYCQDNMAQQDCNSWCKDKSSFMGMYQYEATIKSAATNQCYGDNLIYLKPGATCGSKPGATCRDKGNLLSDALRCPDGSSHDFTGGGDTDCGPGYFCCY